MPRETLLTNMSNDPGAADNDFARPVSEGEGKEDQEGGRRGRMNCDAKLTQTSFVAPPASERARAAEGAIWVNLFGCVHFARPTDAEDRRPRLGPRGGNLGGGV